MMALAIMLAAAPISLSYGVADLSPVPARVSPEEARVDVDTLVFALQRAYGGYAFHAPGLMATVESDLHALVASDLTPSLLCSRLNRIFERVPDSHLSASPPHGVECTTRPHRSAHVGANVAPSFPGKAVRPWKVTTVRVEGVDVPVIGISRFPAAEDRVWDGFSKAVEALVRAPLLVVDLRGNGGGDDTRGFELARRLGRGFVRMRAVERTQRRTIEALAIQINRFELLRAEAEARGSDTSALTKLIADFTQQKGAADNGTLPEVMTDHLEHKAASRPTMSVGAASIAPFQGQLLILADAACGSSGESTLDALLGVPCAVFVGEPTAGVLQYGNVGRVLLRNSKIQVQMGTQYVRYADDVVYETKGFEPHVNVPPGRDALGFALSHAVLKFR